MPTKTSYSAHDVSSLNAAISAIDGAPAKVGAFTITLKSGLTGTNALQLTSALDAINLAKGDTLTIIGNNDTIDGGGDQRGFFVYSGKVTIENIDSREHEGGRRRRRA